MDERNLLERVERLERSHRRVKRVAWALAVALVCVPVLAFTVSDTDASHRIVYASKFALRDPRTGKVRAELAHQTMAGGWAGITFWDESGRPRAEFKFWEDGKTRLTMMDENRRELLGLSVTATGTPTITVDGAPIPTH